MDTLTLNETRADSICSEDFFHRTLVLERKRTERTGRPFLLVFLDISSLLEDAPALHKEYLAILDAALSASTRDVDVKGWYTQGSVLGVICSEVSKSASVPLVGKIKKKLAEAFKQPELSKLKMYLIRYPEYESRTVPSDQKSPIPELQPERKGMFYS